MLQRLKLKNYEGKGGQVKFPLRRTGTSNCSKNPPNEGKCKDLV